MSAEESIQASELSDPIAIAVPEPSTGVLALLGAAVAITYRRSVSRRAKRRQGHEGPTVALQ
jgi:hypothetical protein